MSAEVQYLQPRTAGYRQLETRFDVNEGIMWCFMKPESRPCFNPGLLGELRKYEQATEQSVRNELEKGNEPPIRYTVLASAFPGVFNLGGDLALFLGWIREGNREALRAYARACIDVLHPNWVNYDLPVTTISLVQGDAFGGGFEAALCSNVVVAERGSLFGLPEVMFNLFPGMGAYHLLWQRVGAAEAERMMLSGRTYRAEELHEKGIVDVLAEPGEGERAVHDYVADHSRRRNAYLAVRRVRQQLRPVTFESLMDTTEIWVDAALNLSPRDLRLMERLVKAQERVAAPPAPVMRQQSLLVC